MSLNPQEIRQILDALEASDWDEAVVTVGDVSISVARGGATIAAAQPLAPASPAAVPQRTDPVVAAPVAAAPVAAAPVAAVPVAAPASGVDVPSPTVGLFWRAPQPGAPPFVEVGQVVQLGEVLCIVEVMKLMYNVTAEVAGTVVAIHVENAQAVEFNQPLMTILP